jgi:Uncharacterised nucleotidyltransferase
MATQTRLAGESRQFVAQSQANHPEMPVPPFAGGPEERLILACARTVVTLEGAQRIRELAGQGMDWSRLIRIASRNGVTPLVCRNLMTVCADLMPPTILSDCSDYWRHHAAENLYQASELIRILRLLERHEILAIPLKGPALAVIAYRNLSLRQFCDLDILVPKRTIRTVIRLLADNGFTLQRPPTWIERLPTPASRKKDYGLISHDGRVRLEVHWRLSGTHFDLPVSARHLWGCLFVVTVAGCAVRSLPPPELLLYLTMHGSRHGWERLQWVCDVAELLRSTPDLNWVRLWREANALGNERNLALGLHLAHTLLDAQLPRAALDRICVDPSVENIARQISDRLFADQPSSSGIDDWRQYHLRVKERLRDRVKLRLHYYSRYLRMATNPTAEDRSLVQLPRALSFLYYVLRPLRLLRRYVGAPFLHGRKPN